MIDSNVFVYVLFSDPSYGERAKELLKIAENEETYSSTIVISQVLSHLERRKKIEVIPIFVNYLQQSGINIIETTWEDIVNALKLLQSLGLSYKLWDDAIISNQMKRLRIDLIYSNDTDFDLLQVKREF
ncbi:type II toxin-antitoxin system VapC family toxin [Saccharolobus islandicus]|uniref:PilT protein domain protein n=1 Tax=Saccharolobus islandicus (strain M.16.4 / Kamchatka \|nr:type II toxin-antitoxin system VapC family toxin [Sulfolobus islandicus]ACR41442.1 PilT protein domain protein [Sulfolobus islandicus M.16.4]